MPKIQSKKIGFNEEHDSHATPRVIRSTRFIAKRPDFNNAIDRKRVAQGLYNFYLQRAMVKKSLEINKGALTKEFGGSRI